MILAAVAEAQRAGARLAAACDVIGLPARTVQRWRRTGDCVGEDQRRGPKQRPANALTADEDAELLKVLGSDKYLGVPPKQLVPQLADEGLYLASESTMYRRLRRFRARRPQAERTGTVTRATQLHAATGPNQVWSWDITWLPTVVTGKYLFLYLVMDVWSRRIVGWTVESTQTAELASALMVRICAELRLDPNGLVLHSDNGAPMRGQTMVATLQALGIIPSFSRPHVSDDNPYSESLFRTLKSAPSYPRPFVDVDAASAWVARFVAWYNASHRHSGIAFVTPDQRHAGDDVAVLAARATLYRRAQQANPERWSGSPRSWSPPATVTLNPPRASE